MNIQKITRQYRLNQWMEKIRECRSSGQTIVAWCTEHDISPKTYYYWLKRVRLAACEALPATGGTTQQIVPVKLPSPAEFNQREQQPSSAIILRFSSVIVELHNEASPTLIENTLKALHNVR